MSSLSASSPGSSFASACEADSSSVVITTYDQQGFETVVTEFAGFSTAVKSYNDQGFLITPTAVGESCTATTSPVAELKATESGVSSNGTVSTTTSAVASAYTGAATQKHIARCLCVVCGMLGGIFII